MNMCESCRNGTSCGYAGPQCRCECHEPSSAPASQEQPKSEYHEMMACMHQLLADPEATRLAVDELWQEEPDMMRNLLMQLSQLPKCEAASPRPEMPPSCDAQTPLEKEMLAALKKIKVGGRSMCLHLNLRHRDFSNKDNNIEASSFVEKNHNRALADWYFELAECIRVAEIAIARGEAATVQQEPLPRIETGNVQFDNDWPGVFFRGDTAINIARQLRDDTKDGKKVGFERLGSLIDFLEDCHVELDHVIQRVKRMAPTAPRTQPLVEVRELMRGGENGWGDPQFEVVLGEGHLRLRVFSAKGNADKFAEQVRAQFFAAPSQKPEG